ncbi:MAG: glycosyltransferase, partial [Pyrinomonadaceae bacterium]
MKPELSIIIPAFEEEERIGDSLEKIFTFLIDSPNTEVIVVDDGSKDSTAEISSAVCGQFPKIASNVIRYNENKGKGFAVRTGLLAASADIALFSDADLSTPIDEMSKLVDPIMSGDYDVTFGSRALDRSLIGTHQPCRREQGGKV